MDQRAVHDSLVARSTRLAALRSTWLDGDTPAAAGAALAAAISSVGERTGVTIGALDIRVDSGASQAFVPVRIHATAVGDIQGLGSFVAGLEGGALALTIRALSIDAADGAAPPNRAEVLNAELTVESPWRRGAMETSP
ncbi:MAG TPA: GspMb/PilO family protein [Gemmatimonadaceae bacterium]|nr:GspMb/PilO family protein [Gemmatimonadaceae bacterium]